MEPQGAKPTARGRGRTVADPAAGVEPVPEDNQPGHHPDHEQDQPDLDDFAEKFGVTGAEAGGPTGGSGVTGAPAGGAPDRPRRATSGAATSRKTEGKNEGAGMPDNEKTTSTSSGGTAGTGAGGAGASGEHHDGHEHEPPSLHELRDRGLEIARDTASWAIDSMRWAMSAMTRRKGEHSGR
jgi:hypothetical protein